MKFGPGEFERLPHRALELVTVSCSSLSLRVVIRTTCYCLFLFTRYVSLRRYSRKRSAAASGFQVFLSSQVSSTKAQEVAQEVVEKPIPGQWRVGLLKPT